MPIPVVLPKILVRRENRHLVHSSSGYSALHGEIQVVDDTRCIAMRKLAPERVVLQAKGLNGQQACKGSLFKVDDALTVCCAALWKDLNRCRFAFDDVLLTF